MESLPFSSPTIGKLAEALAKAQATMKPAVKDKKNPFFKTMYADLSNVWDSIREPLTKNGLSVVQITQTTTEGLNLSTVLAHSSGEWIRADYPITPTKNDPQGVGSAVTYARRYALAAMVGVCTEDDDGESASDRSGGVDSGYQRLNNIADAKKAAAAAPVDWDSFPYRYRLPEKKPGWNMKQVEASLTTNGVRKNHADGLWYSRKHLEQLSEYEVKQGGGIQEDIVFTDEHLNN
jgi:hypothetical protein